MDQLKPVESKMSELFKGLPQMSSSAKQTLAKWMEWIALIFGVLQLLAAWGFWSAGHRVNSYVDYANSISRAFGAGDVAPKLGITYYIALVILVVSAVTLLMAYPGLKARKKIGWDWLFLGSLVNLVYGVASVFVNSYYGGGADNLIMSLVSSAIGFYLLFQVREVYTGKHAPAASVEKK